MAMHNPLHPGGIVKGQSLEPLGLTVTQAAEGLGVTRQALSELVNGRTGVSVEMAIRLSKAFGSTPEPRPTSHRSAPQERSHPLRWPGVRGRGPEHGRGATRHGLRRGSWPHPTTGMLSGR